MHDELILEVGQLVPELCRAHYERARSMFQALGLWRGQPAILQLLWEKDGRAQTELANALSVRPATITKMIRRMEASGFVQRRPDPADQRMVRVYLTPAGQSIRAEVDAVCRRLAEETLAGLTKEELLLLRRLLIRMHENLCRCSGQRRGSCCCPTPREARLGGTSDG